MQLNGELDELGNVPFIVKQEEWYNQYQKSKKRILELNLYKNCNKQMVTSFNASQKIRKLNKSNSKSFKIIKMLSVEKKHFDFIPSTKEIKDVNSTLPFEQFYKGIKKEHCDPINIEKEMKYFVRRKIRQRNSLLGKNFISTKSTESFERKCKVLKFN